MHEELKKAIAKILQAAKEHGKGSGIYCTSGDQAREFADQGFQMVGKDSGICPIDTDALVPGLGGCGYDRPTSISDLCSVKRKGLICSFGAEHGKGSGFGDCKDDWTVWTIASVPYRSVVLLAIGCGGRIPSLNLCMPFSFLNQSLHLFLCKPMHHFSSFGRNVRLGVRMVYALHMKLKQTPLSITVELVVGL